MTGAPFPCRVDGNPVTAAVLDDGLLVDGHLLAWLDMDTVTEGNHTLTLGMVSGPPRALTHTGTRHDELVEVLRRARGRARRSALTQATTEPLDHYEARGTDGAITDVYLFPHVLTVEPRGGAVTSVPLPLVERVERDGYAITVTARALGATRLRGFGKRTDEVLADLARAREDLRRATAAVYASLEPSLGGLDVPDGWATDRAAAGTQWGTLRAAVCGGTRAAEAEVLVGLAGDRLRLGVFTEGGRFPLPFLLAPVGGRVVVEGTGDDEARATFVFATGDVDRLNAALLVMAFRREALFLPADTLGRWAVAVRTVPLVRWARESLVARVVHDDAWEASVRRAVEGG